MNRETWFGSDFNILKVIHLYDNSQRAINSFKYELALQLATRYTLDVKERIYKLNPHSYIDKNNFREYIIEIMKRLEVNNGYKFLLKTFSHPITSASLLSSIHDYIILETKQEWGSIPVFVILAQHYKDFLNSLLWDLYSYDKIEYISNPFVTNMAGIIRAESTFQDMPILADACEDNGILDNNLLSHLRSNCKHSKYCWALEILINETSNP